MGRVRRPAVKPMNLVGDCGTVIGMDPASGVVTVALHGIVRLLKNGEWVEGDPRIIVLGEEE